MSSSHEEHASISRAARRCNCAPFRKAWAAYHRDYRARRKAATGEAIRRGRFVSQP
jgi:hypothetical protein